MALRVGFAGTPVFAVTALRAIVDAGFNIALVLSRPDKPKGRGLKVEPSAVKTEALRRAFPVLQPPTLKRPTESERVLTHALDVLVVAAYGLILPPDVLGWPRYGCLNIHASLLPRWRGAAPIQRAIEAGDLVSGVTIMQMDAGLDTGAMVATREVVLDARETAGTLRDKLAAAGADLIVQALLRLGRNGTLPATPQPAEGATYAPKIGREEALIDWRRDVSAIDRQVRALNPAPGASTEYAGAAIKVWRAEPLPGAPGAVAGTLIAVHAGGLDVACGQGSLRLVEVQPAGGKRMAARAFASGRAIGAGTRFGATRIA